MLALQRVQNRALRFITGAKWYEYRTAESLHQETNLVPVNQVIYNQARKTWESIRDFFPDLYDGLVRDSSEYPYHARFPSSRKQAEGVSPAPIFC